MGEGRVSLGITGRDQVAEHDAGVEAIARQRAESGKSTPSEGAGPEMGVEEVMDLDFGACKLQLQVPEKGKYADPSDLIGKNIGTSFVHLAEDYFAALEQKAEPTTTSNGEIPNRRKLKTKIIELSGSVEAACALGVADGVVDLVGTNSQADLLSSNLTKMPRIRRNHEGSRPQGNRHRSLQHRDTRQVQKRLKPGNGRPHRRAHKRRHQ